MSVDLIASEMENKGGTDDEMKAYTAPSILCFNYNLFHCNDEARIIKASMLNPNLALECWFSLTNIY